VILSSELSTILWKKDRTDHSLGW